MQDGTGDETAAVHQPLDAPGPPPPGTRIGDWTVGALVGAGGSSVVVTATRTTDGLTQRAALKLLRFGSTDLGFARRLRRERQILQGLSHPSIVRLLDAGATPGGQPWYAMDLIEGTSLTAWCAGQPLAARLRALIEVCRAVDHAHQRLVVHCDLKPANVLVDPDGVPHVLDFGIARLVGDGADLTGAVRLMTPRWAAPEQRAGEPVTVATDVYALGLLLWAVLTGDAPRAGRSGAALLAANDPIPPPSLKVPACRGDLDAIVARALAPVPGERYHSARALADDLARHLRGEAVLARRGLGYRAARWVNRNRLAASGLLLLAGLLVGWGSTATLQARSIRAERDRAEETLDLLVGILEAADPAVARGDSLTVQEVLQAGARELAVRSSDPRIAGEVRLALGRVYEASGDRPASRDAFAAALEQLRSVYPAEHPLMLQAELGLAFAEANLSGHDPAAIARAESVVARMTDPPARARGLMLVTDLRAVQGELDRAEAHAEAAIAAHAALGDARGVARSRALLGLIAIQQGRGPETLELALRETEEALGTRQHPDIADILHELAGGTEGETALRYAEENIALRRALHGEGWLLAATLNNYGLALEAIDPERAAQTMRDAARMAAADLGEAHPGVMHIQINQGAVLVDVGYEAEGLAVLREVSGRPGLAPAERARALGHIARVEARRASVAQDPP